MAEIKELELIEVEYEGENKATMTFLDEEKGEIREVTFRKEVYNEDTKKYVYDEEKAKKVDEWCDTYFGLTFDTLTQAIGETKKVYIYDNFCSLWEVEQINKFDKDMVDEILQDCVVTNVELKSKGIQITFEYEGKKYASNMGYSKWIDARKEYLVNPQKQKKQFERFEEKFGISIEDKEQLIGKTVMVEVKKHALNGGGTYADIKPFSKRKK